MNIACIDVSCKELVVVISVDGNARKAKTFDNTSPGHVMLIKSLSKLKDEVYVCLEATGIYHFDLAVALSRVEDIKVRVINPKAAHNFAKILMKRSKTDAIDAEILAISCERMPFEAWDRPDDENIIIRAIARRIATLNKIKAQTKNQYHALNATQEAPNLMIEHTEKLIALLEKQIEALRGSALKVILNHDELSEAYELMISI